MTVQAALQEENSVNDVHYIDDDDGGQIPVAPESTEEVVVDGGVTPLEVTVEDDTPVDDQGRAPLPEAIREGLEEDTEEYSKGVKERINQMRKAMHDERREKEAAQRRETEATRMAQQSYQEASNLRGQLTQGQTWALEQARERGALAAAMAQQKLRQAIEDGDADAQATAQADLSQAQNFQQQVAQITPQTAPKPQAQQNVAPQQQQAYAQPNESQAPVDTRAQAWADKNSEWFGVDDKMTKFALNVHQTLVGAGVAPTSDTYYERIEQRLAEEFPKKFGKQQPPSTVVAPAGRVPQGKRVVLTRSMVQLAENMGLTKEQYARELIKMGNV